MSLRHCSWLVVSAALLVTACATAPAGQPQTDRDVLTAAEMQKAGNNDLLLVIQTLRPRWLSTRGRDSINSQGYPVVFLDGIQLGTPETLESLNVNTVAEIRYFDGPTAMARWGMCCGHGVIYVTTLPHSTNPT